MKLMLFEPGLREKFITAGLERAKKFTWRKTAEETLAVINELKPL
jgi:glycosyltransferase involved in cell wall biosynthesis